jgi:hypothetical protein
VAGSDADWNTLQILTWAYLRDRGLVESYSSAAAAARQRWTEVIVPDGTKDVVRIPSRPSTLTLTLEAAQRGAFVSVPPQLQSSNQPPLPKGYEITAPPPAALGPGVYFSSLEAAEEDVDRHFVRGTLTVTGRRNGRGLHERIPDRERRYLKIDFDANQAVPRGGEVDYWSELEFVASEAVRTWPKPTEASATLPPAAARSAPLDEAEWAAEEIIATEMPTSVIEGETRATAHAEAEMATAAAYVANWDVSNARDEGDGTTATLDAGAPSSSSVELPVVASGKSHGIIATHAAIVAELRAGVRPGEHGGPTLKKFALTIQAETTGAKPYSERHMSRLIRKLRQTNQLP